MTHSVSMTLKTADANVDGETATAIGEYAHALFSGLDSLRLTYLGTPTGHELGTYALVLSYDASDFVMEAWQGIKGERDMRDIIVKTVTDIARDRHGVTLWSDR